jgi:hypothetical protein
MMGRQDRDQRQLFYEFSLDEMIPTGHLLRRIVSRRPFWPICTTS